MRCQCCDSLLTIKEEEYNINNPQRDGKEFCYECMRYCNIIEYAKIIDECLSDSTNIDELSEEDVVG